MSTELLIGIQAALVIITVMIILLLIIRRQKQTINKLKEILTTVKDDISGQNLTGYLQLEIDNTTAHCREETVALKPELMPEDMAIALRYIALEAELTSIQSHIESNNTSWREQIKRYVTLAEQITEIIKARIDNATKTLNELHNEELNTKNANIADLETQNKTASDQLDLLKPLVTCMESASSGDVSRPDLELQLHKALLSLCENFDDSEDFRELVYLIHEAFHASHSSSDTNQTPAIDEKNEAESPTPSTDNFSQSQNMAMLNNIIDQQNHTIKTLREQIQSLENHTEQESLSHTINTLESTIQQSSACMDSMLQETQYEPMEAASEEETANEMIDKFIEESAVMVEKIHMLSNQNKQLMLENDEMRATLESSTESDEPLVAGLKLKISSQKDELVALQQSFTELESRYLELYDEKSN
jgi:uncharacterized protein YoxC